MRLSLFTGFLFVYLLSLVVLPLQAIAYDLPINYAADVGPPPLGSAPGDWYGATCSWHYRCYGSTGRAAARLVVKLG